MAPTKEPKTQKRIRLAAAGLSALLLTLVASWLPAQTPPLDRDIYLLAVTTSDSFTYELAALLSQRNFQVHVDTSVYGFGFESGRDYVLTRVFYTMDISPLVYIGAGSQTICTVYEWPLVSCQPPLLPIPGISPTRKDLLRVMADEIRNRMLSLHWIWSAPGDTAKQKQK